MNIITGSVGGGSYNAAMTVLRAGAPDDNSTTVVFMFDHVVACSEIQATGWDKRVTNMTQALEIKMLGKTVKSYSVPTEASVNYTLTVQTGTPAESVSTTGTAALEVAVTDGSKAQGNFDVTFNNGHLAGRFDATFCPGGVEP